MKNVEDFSLPEQEKSHVFSLPQPLRNRQKNQTAEKIRKEILLFCALKMPCGYAKIYY